MPLAHAGAPGPGSAIASGYVGVGVVVGIDEGTVLGSAGPNSMADLMDTGRDGPWPDRCTTALLARSGHHCPTTAGWHQRRACRDVVA